MSKQFADDGNGNLLEVPTSAMLTGFEDFDMTEDLNPLGGSTLAKKPLAQEIAEATAKPRKVRPSHGPKPASAPSTMPSPANFDLLTRILQSKRSHNSSGDLAFRKWLYSQFPSYYTKAGNLVVTTDEKSDVLFSCHIDTCHSPTVSDDKPQSLDFDPNLGHIFLAPESQKPGHVLGADDGAGIYIMLRMIAAKVPGTYVFHVGEEVGCIGSRKMLETEAKWLSKFNLAVAFDRPQSFEVIHTQGGQTCASIKCATALALALSNDKLAYEPSANGVLTDTKHYRNIIPECFNIGVGYAFQHSPQEYQDVYHLEELATRCCQIKWSALPVDRDPTEVPVYRGFFPEHQYGQGKQVSAPKPAPKVPPKRAKLHPSQMDYETLCEWVYSETDDAITYLVQLQVQLAASEAQADKLAHLLGVKL